MQKFDLNLLPVVVAIAEEKSVSRAAQSLGMSQPAVSSALHRLRLLFNDELFVRTASGMQPTPRALMLIEPAREILARVAEDVLQSEVFNTAKPIHVTVALSDSGEMVVLPTLLRRIQEEAPNATLSSVTLPASELEQALESGRIDLAVGYFPDILSNNFFQQRLFSHGFTCLVRAQHKIRGKELSMQQFLDLGHAVVKAEGRSQEVFERFLQSRNVQRRVVLSTPHFMSIPFIVATTDLVATVPLAVGTSFASFANIRLIKPPFDIPSFDLRQNWHRKFNHDPKNIWLRNLIADTFSNDTRW